MSETLQIACDEAGHTGPDLLNPEQRYFGYGSVSIADDEARAMINAALRAHPLQMKELKAARLMRSKNGQALIADLIKAADGRFAVNVHDKLLALCGWVFEYIYEPVYQRDPSIFYKKNFNRFVAMFTYLWFNDDGVEAEESIRQFQAYMRTLDESAAPLLFGRIDKPLGKGENEHPFELVLRFAHGYREMIIADNARLNSVLPEEGRWLLDLSTSALWSHLNHWGKTGKPLQIRCDVSKPLEASVDKFTGDEKDPGIIRARELGYDDPLGWKMTERISFVDSQDHAAIQLADIIAGSAVYCLGRGVPEGFEEAIKIIERHVLEGTILPNHEMINLTQREPAVNYFILYDLAERAESKADPYDGLAKMYWAAEVSWAKGKFPQVKKSD